MASHTAAHVVPRALIKRIEADARATFWELGWELGAIVASRAGADVRASAEKLQGAVGFDDYVGEIVSARIIGVGEVVLSRLGAVKVGVILVDRLVLYVDELVICHTEFGVAC